MIALAFALAASVPAATVNGAEDKPLILVGKPWEGSLPADFIDMKFGSGPYLLVILAQPPIQIPYATGTACGAARKSIAEQTAPRATPGGGVMISGVEALCIPR